MDDSSKELQKKIRGCTNLLKAKNISDDVRRGLVDKIKTYKRELESVPHKPVVSDENQLVRISRKISELFGPIVARVFLARSHILSSENRNIIERELDQMKVSDPTTIEASEKREQVYIAIERVIRGMI